MFVLTVPSAAMRDIVTTQSGCPDINHIHYPFPAIRWFSVIPVRGKLLGENLASTQ